MPVLLAHAIEDSTDIVGFFFWGGGFEPLKPHPRYATEVTYACCAQINRCIYSWCTLNLRTLICLPHLFINY